jgi:hypothetical protein
VVVHAVEGFAVDTGGNFGKSEDGSNGSGNDSFGENQ